MFKFVRVLLLFTLFISASLMSHAEVYKWKDADGKWRYSDIRPMKTKNVKLLYAKKSKRHEASKLDDTIDDAGKSNASNQQISHNDNRPTQLLVEQEDLEVKRRNCVGAKANLTIYNNGGRIRRANAKGEMNYLSDADIEKMKSKAQQDVNQYCA